MYRRIDPADGSAQGRTSPPPTDQHVAGSGGAEPGDGMIGHGDWDTGHLGQSSWRDHLDADWRSREDQRRADRHSGSGSTDQDRQPQATDHDWQSQATSQQWDQPPGRSEWDEQHGRSEWDQVAIEQDGVAGQRTPDWTAGDPTEGHPIGGPPTDGVATADGYPTGDDDPGTTATSPALRPATTGNGRAARRRAARLAGERTASRTGRPGDRKRFAPGPIALAALVAVLLVAIVGGVAMLRAGLADGPGDGGGPTTLAADDASTPATDGPYGGDEPQIGEPEVLGVELGPAPTPSPTPAPSTAAPTPAAPDRGAPERPATDPTTPTRPTPTTAAPGGADPGPTTAGGGGNDFEQQVLAIVNSERDANGCGAVVINTRLSEASRLHSEDQAATRTMSHTGSDGSDPWRRAERAGYQRAIGENVAAGYPTAEAVMDGWMNSPGHRANILNCDAVAMGVGTAAATDGTLYWTQMFGAVA